MLLTKKGLDKILQDWRIAIPAKLEKELLEEYGNLVTDDEDHLRDYTEQDICEQLRKKLLPYVFFASRNSPLLQNIFPGASGENSVNVKCISPPC